MNSENGKNGRIIVVEKEGLVIKNGELVGHEGKVPSHLTIPDGVTGIKRRAFEGCLELESVVIPDTVRLVEGLAFEECANLSSVSIPDNGMQLHAAAFEKCLSLKTLDIPPGTDVVGEFNFYAHFHPDEAVDVPDFVSVIETRGWTGGGICDDKKGDERTWYMAFNVRTPFYRCDSVRFYDHVRWNLNLDDSFQECNKLVLCSYETKEVKRVLWINGNDTKRWGRWGVHRYLTEYAAVKEGEIILNHYDKFLLTLARAEDKSMAMLYRLCYPADLDEEDKQIFMDYLNKNRRKVMNMVIDHADPALLKTAAQVGLITKRNVDSLIRYAENTQKMSMAEGIKEWKLSGLNERFF